MTNASIDAAIFTQLQNDMGDFIAELVDTYLAETPTLIDALHKSLAEQDAETFRRNAHSIKSSSAALGALDFSEQARQLEMIGKSGDLSTAAPLLAGLVAAYAGVDRELTELAHGS